MAVEVAPVESQLRPRGRDDRLVPGEPSVGAWGEASTGAVAARAAAERAAATEAEARAAGKAVEARAVCKGGAHLTKHAPKSAALCPCGWASVGTTKAASLPKDAHSSRMSSTHWLGLGLRSGLGLGSG